MIPDILDDKHITIIFKGKLHKLGDSPLDNFLEMIIDPCIHLLGP